MSTMTGTSTGTINGIDVGLTATIPSFATNSIEISADITTGGSSQDINIALVIDTSGSTDNDSGSDVDGDSSNGTETFLEAQQLAAKALFQSLIDAGYDPENVTVTLVEYATGSNLVGEFNLSEQSAFETAVDGLDSSGLTNFDAGLDEVIAAWQATTTDGNADDNPPSEVSAGDTNRIIFLSDGEQNRGSRDYSDELQTLSEQFNAPVTAIGIGANAVLERTDGDGDVVPGGLNDVDSSGSATQITDLSLLPALLNAPPPLPELREVQFIVTEEDGEQTIVTVPAGDARIIETAAGLRIDGLEITGYDFELGETLDIEVRAVFDPTGDTLVVDGLLVPMFVCFARGTRILTLDGEKPIEDLRVGDRVVTRDRGAQPLRWIGSTHLPAEALARRPETRPVKFCAGALGEGLPRRDLWVSRQHRVLVRGWRAELLFGSSGGVLTPAFTLVNDDTITVDTPAEGIEYFHLAFDGHEVVYSEGLETESFHPNAATVSALTAAQRDELFALFPELEHGELAMPAARPELRGRDGTALAPSRRASAGPL